jgi:hypothetical protein
MNAALPVPVWKVSYVDLITRNARHPFFKMTMKTIVKITNYERAVKQDDGHAKQIQSGKIH